MSGLPWFELDTDYHDSPKVEALKSRLRNNEADAFPSRLYAYCYRHAVDRFDADVACQMVESAAKWRGRRTVLFDALFAVGILEREGGKVVVHGVAERLAPHLSKRLGDAERQRRRRDRAAASIGRPADVTSDVTRDVPRESRRDKDKDRDTDKDPETSNVSRLPAQGRARAAATLGPLGIDLVSRVESGLGHGLAPLRSQDQAEELEAAIWSRGGRDEAYQFIAATYRQRNTEPKSVAWLLAVLKDQAAGGVQ